MKHSFLILALAAGLGACATPGTNGDDSVITQPAGKVTLEGSAAYRERIALPPTARLVVEIRDVSLADAPAPLIASTEVKAEGRQVPLPFAIEYDAGRINPRHRYAVSARILEGNKLLWITDTHVPLPAAGSGPLMLNLVSAAR